MPERGPIRKTLEDYHKEEKTLLCMPGHKGRGLAPLGPAFDVTEMSFLDDLSQPRACIAASEKWLAGLYDTRSTYALVNGATAGIMAGVFNLPSDTKTLLVPGQAHRSVLTACILRGIEPVFLAMDYEQGLYLPPTSAAYMEGGPGPALIMTPTYQGIIYDYKDLAADRLLLADEAHGSHLYWLEETTALSYADYVVHGTHKTLGSLTQTGLIHRGKDGVQTGALRQKLSLVQSSSPYWPFLVSLEDAVLTAERLKRQGAWEKRAEEVSALRAAISRIQGLEALEDLKRPYQLDPLRLSIQVKNGRATDYYQRLAQLGVEMEAVIAASLIGICTPFDPAGQDQSLLKALRQVDEELGQLPPLEARGGEGKRHPLRHIRLMDRRAALFGPKESLALDQAPGRISAGFVSLYPPGVPLLLPGDRVEIDHIERIKTGLALGQRLENIEDGQILVIKE